MRSWFNHIVRRYLDFRYRSIRQFMEDPMNYQQSIFRDLLDTARDTRAGRKYHFNEIRSQEEYARLPIVEYDDIKAEIEEMMRGEKDILWPGQVKWFAKSSGTTSDKSKFIPVSQANLKNCHIKGSWDSIAIMYNKMPDARVFADKSLVMGGSLDAYPQYPETRFGDVSAIMLYHLPLIGRPFFTPDMETALLADWEEKISRMANIVKDENIFSFGGVPTWTIVLFKRILELTGKSNMLEVWPNARAYAHGGVGFEPYRAQFDAFFPSEAFIYQETYNASEGFFAIQHDRKEDDLLLLLNNGIYYEFVPMEHWGDDHPEAVPLEGVVTGKPYALIVSTNAGLWRYTPGDVVTFTNTQPYMVKVTGRTNQYINVFGEEVMVANTDKALSRTCDSFAVHVRDYSVGPVFLDVEHKGGHHWVIEFEQEPEDVDHFGDILDQHLQRINSDYEAKRYKDMALQRLEITAVPKGTFQKWMKKRGKLGGQHKVPRLSNTRKFIDDILKTATDQ